MESKNLLNQLLSEKNYRIYNISLAKMVGLTNAIFFQRLIQWFEYVEENEIYRTTKQIQEDTLLSEYQIKEAKKYLQDKGWVMIQVKGLPAKSYYSINYDKVFEDYMNFIGSSTKLVRRYHQTSSAISPTNDGDITKHTYKETNKKVKEEGSPEIINIILELDRTGTALVSKKQFIKVLGFSDNYAKNMEKELKGIGDIKARKDRLVEIVTNGEVMNHYKSKKSYDSKSSEVRVTVPDGFEEQDFEDLRQYYEGQLNVPIIATDQMKYDFHRTMQQYSFDQILYVARNLLQASKENSFYARSFGDVIKLETVQKFISDPILKKMEDRY